MSHGPDRAIGLTFALAFTLASGFAIAGPIQVQGPPTPPPDRRASVAQDAPTPPVRPGGAGTFVPIPASLVPGFPGFPAAGPAPVQPPPRPAGPTAPAGPAGPAATDPGTTPSSGPQPPAGTGRALTMQEARALFAKMGDRAARDGFTPDHTWDGCWWKAREFEMAAVDAGIPRSSIRRIHLVPGKKTGVGWNYHTAVVIPVLDDRGRPQDMVFDPSLMSGVGPMPVSAYARRMFGGRGYTRDDDAKDRPFRRDEAYISLVENSLDRPGHIYPPAYGNPDTSATVASAQASALRMFRRDYSDPARRYEWRNRPSWTTRVLV